jgi:uncharacterized protein (DUF305 family)
MKILPFPLAGLAFVALIASAQPMMQHDHGDFAAPSVDAPDPAFQREMMAAMRKMDQDMNVRHSGNADRDFAAMMIPHHQGAIDMAKAELQYGHDPVLRRLAQGIIVEQQQEIELMRRQLDHFRN